MALQTSELPHDKTIKMTCAPSEDLDQPGHPHSLIRIFAVLMKKAWVLRPKKNTRVSTNPTYPTFKHRLCYFYRHFEKKIKRLFTYRPFLCMKTLDKIK